MTSSMDDSYEEFEPLFDYTRIQPLITICLDDDDSPAPNFCSKRQKVSNTEAEKKGQKDDKVAEVINCDEEDWLDPPPKNLDDSRKILEDSTLKALRLKKQELESLTQSAEEVMRATEESVRKNLMASLQSSPGSVPKKSVEPTHERETIVISIQDKNEVKHIRVNMDEKFDRLFTKYAEKAKLNVKDLVFCFDGDKISPAATPDSLGMEENDIIEVYVKSK